MNKEGMQALAFSKIHDYLFDILLERDETVF